MTNMVETSEESSEKIKQTVRPVSSPETSEKKQEEFRFSAQEEERIKNICQMCNAWMDQYIKTGYSSPETRAIDQAFYQQYSPIRIDCENAMERRRDLSVAPIFKTANDGNWLAVTLQESSGLSGYYAIVPKFVLTYQSSTHGPGAGQEMFDFDNPLSEIYYAGDINAGTSRASFISFADKVLKDDYRIYTVIAPCIMERDNEDNWKIVQKGRLHLGEGPVEKPSGQDLPLSQVVDQPSSSVDHVLNEGQPTPTVSPDNPAVTSPDTGETKEDSNSEDDQRSSVAIKEETGRPKTGREKFSDSAAEVTNSWSNKQKQTLSKLAEAVLIFQKGYLEKALRQPDLSDEDKETIKKTAVIYAKQHAKKWYDDPRLALPKKDKETVITLIPKLFS